MSNLTQRLQAETSFTVRQRHELAELFGYETRNKYEILDQSGQAIGFAAEQQKGFWNFLVRQFLGHWRSFEVLFFDQNRQLIWKCRHPFRWIFNRFEIEDAQGQKLGDLQQRFAVFSRRFDVHGPRGEVVLEMRSPLFRIWTFKFLRREKEVARIEKKWSGILSEGFTDKDTFRLTLADPNLDLNTRSLLLAACIFVDLMYFERKAD